MRKFKFFGIISAFLVPVIALAGAFTLHNYQPITTYADLAGTDAGCKNTGGTALLTPIPSGYVNNTATVSSTVADSVSSNNTDFVCNQIKYVTDLSIKKTHTPTSPLPGQTVTYTIEVTNAGPSVSTGVTITDALPSGLDSSTAVYTVTQGGGTFNSSNGQWTGLNLTVGQSAKLTIAATVKSTTTGVVTNDARVSPLAPTGATDPTPDNGQTPNSSDSLASGSTNPNGALDQYNVTAQADLALLKTSSGNFVSGAPATYTLKVTNNGPSTATNMTITDTLPTGISYDSAATNTANTSTGWTCSASGQTITCTNAGPLANGSNSSAIIKVKVS